MKSESINQPDIPEANEEQENIEEKAEAETRLKEYEIYQLVGPPEADNTRIEVFDADTDNARFVMSKKMTPQEDEKDLMPEGSVMTVTVQGTRKQKKKDSYWEVTGAKFDLNGKELKLEDILPEDCKLVLNKEETNAYLVNEKTISLDRLSEINDVVTLLHEAGHAHDSSLEQDSIEKLQNMNPDMTEEQIMHHEIASMQTNERYAWAKAHKTARKTDWPIQKIIKNESVRTMATYDQHAAITAWRDSSYGQFATSEQRRAMRNQEKQEEAKHLKELNTHAQQVTLVISHYLDTPLEEILKKDKKKGGKSVSIHFRLPEEGKEYIVDIHKPIVNDVLIEDQVALSVAEIVDQGKEKDPDASKVCIYGALEARVWEGKMQKDEKSEDPNFVIDFEGSLNVLVSGDTKDPEKTYQRTKYLLKKIIQDKTGSRMIIETFRQMYPDAPVPPDHDAKTGKKLALEEKVEYMKKKSQLFQIIDGHKKETENIINKYKNAS